MSCIRPKRLIQPLTHTPINQRLRLGQPRHLHLLLAQLLLTAKFRQIGQPFMASLRPDSFANPPIRRTPIRILQISSVKHAARQVPSGRSYRSSSS